MSMLQTRIESALHRSAGRTGVLEELPACQRALVEEALHASLRYVDNPLFSRPTAARQFGVQAVPGALASTDWYHPTLDVREDGPGAHAPRPSPRGHEILDAAQEKLLFLRYNYARKRTALAVRRFLARPTKRGALLIAASYQGAKSTCELITRANLALVLAMVKRSRVRDIDSSELISEGNLALLRAVEAFDVGRGFKFASYACRVILRAFSRLARYVRRYRVTFPNGFDQALEVDRSHHLDNRRAEREADALEELRGSLGINRARLSDVELTVIRARFALQWGTSGSLGGEGSAGGGARRTGMTLAEVGRFIGVTKERARQIQNNALPKLRASIERP